MPKVLTKEDSSDQEESPYYLVTTGMGRQCKAHLPKDGDESVCGYGGSRMKRVDKEVVEKFHKKCVKCQRKKQKN